MFWRVLCITGVLSRLALHQSKLAAEICDDVSGEAVTHKSECQSLGGLLHYMSPLVTGPMYMDSLCHRQQSVCAAC